MTAKGKKIVVAAFVKQPRLLRRAETQKETLDSRRRHAEPKIQPVHTSRSRDYLQDPLLFRPKAQSWSYSPTTTEEPKQSPSAPHKSEREHIGKIRAAAEVPHVSDSMPSVTMGYLAFKRVLKNKKQSGSMECRVVDSRFRLMSMDEAELSASSRLIMPKETIYLEEKGEGVHGMFSSQTNLHLVRKDNKQKPGFNRRLSTRVGSKRQLVSSLSWPAGELPMRSPEDRRRSLPTPDLLRAKSKVVPRSRSGMSAKERSALKAERLKRGQSSRSNLRERSHESDEEDEFGSFDETSCTVKIQQIRHKKRHTLGSKLLKPLGTGCFSESFQAAKQWE